MKHSYRYTLLFILLLGSGFISAQGITGTWEGLMGNEYLQVNVEQKGNELCGYTYDYELDNKADHCIAAYVGRYDPEKKIWYISGRSFIENSGTHVFMRIIMWRDPELGRNALRAVVYTGSGLAARFGVGGDEIVLRKKSNTPVKLPSGEPECFPKPVKTPKIATPAPAAPPKSVPPKTSTVPAPAVKPKPTPTKPVTPKPPAEKPAAAKSPVPLKPAPSKPTVKLTPKKDSVKKIDPVAPPVLKPRADGDIVRKMNERKQQEQSRLEVNVKRINLKVYDNGVVDNDTVSIFYNGKLLLSHKRLSEQAIEFNIDLDENVTQHTITLFAENLGGIPPNTAVIVVTAGDKRYELRSKASLEENAVLVFDYRPKD
jgi:hypothetical protein